MNILLVCFAGMSTSILMKKMKEYAEGKDIPLIIKAIPLSELEENYVYADIDIILLGPQVRYALKECEKIVNNKTPIMAIDSLDYGLMKGNVVLDKAIQFLKK